MNSIFVRLLGNYPRVKILDWYLENPNTPYSIQDVYQYVKISRASAYNIVNELYGLGILKYVGLASRAKLYQLNTNNSLTIALQTLDFECKQLERKK